MAAQIILDNDNGGSVLITPANTNATNVTLTLPQESGTLVTTSNIPVATGIQAGGIKYSVTGNTLNIITI